MPPAVAPASAAPAWQSSGRASVRVERTSTQDEHPVERERERERERSDADDYFERLATASASDAPTGMIIMPQVLNPDITGALSRSGDVMVTASMRVSRDLSNYGAYREGLDQIDDGEADDVVTDRGRRELGPVRARDSVASQRPASVQLAASGERGLNTWIWIVAIGIGVVVVAGATVLVVGLTNGWF